MRTAWQRRAVQLTVSGKQRAGEKHQTGRDQGPDAVSKITQPLDTPRKCALLITYASLKSIKLISKANGQMEKAYEAANGKNWTGGLTDGRYLINGKNFYYY